MVGDLHGVNILRVQRDLFAPAFPLPEWKVAGVLLAALFGVPAESAARLLSISVDDVLAIYERHTGRSTWPETQASEG